MEEKLVKVMLDQYKEKGIDMYALLDNKFFTDLKLDQKIDLIKKYASHISSGTSRTLTKKDITALVFDAGFAGTLTAVSAGLAAREAGRFFTRGITPVGAIAGAAALGAAMAAGSTYLRSRKMINERAEILKKIDATSANPTDENALNVLVTRNSQLNPATTVAITSSVGKRLSDTTRNIPAMVLDQVDPVINHLSYLHNWKNQTHGYAPDVTHAEFKHYVDESGKGMINSLNESVEQMRKTILKRD